MNYDKAKGIGDLIKFQINELLGEYAAGKSQKFLENKFRKLAKTTLELKDALELELPKVRHNPH